MDGVCLQKSRLSFSGRFVHYTVATAPAGWPHRGRGGGPRQCAEPLVHLDNLQSGQGEWLLTVDMLASSDRSHGDLLVQEVRCDDVDDIDLGIPNGFPPVHAPP